MSKSMMILAFVASAFVPAWAGDEPTVEEALKKFKKDMAKPDPSARASAVSELAATKSEKTAAALGGLLGQDVEPVRSAAATGLGGFSDYKKKVVPILMAGLSVNGSDPKVMAAIFQALGKLDDDSALPTIHRYFEDKNEVTASAALMAAAEIRKLASIDLILDLMKKYEKIETAAKGNKDGYGNLNIPGGNNNDAKLKLAKDVLPSTVKAMQKISGEKYATLKEWELWWSKHKATFKIDSK